MQWVYNILGEVISGIVVKLLAFVPPFRRVRTRSIEQSNAMVDAKGGDRILFEAFLRILPSSGAIKYLDTHYVTESFRWNDLGELDAFRLTWGGR